MESKSEQIKVGAMVAFVAVMFLSALVFVGGVNLFRKKQVTYTTYFKFAGGLEPGSFVRFGGLRVGTVQAASIDPGDSTRVRVKLAVADGTPIRTNSKARISSLGLLGENYLEISQGTRDAQILPPDSEMHSEEAVQLAEVISNVNTVGLGANKLVNDLDDRILVLADNANQILSSLQMVVGPENRQHLQAFLANADGILDESRPSLKKTLSNVETASGKLPPAIDNANKAVTHADTLVGNFNNIAVENRVALHAALLSLRQSLTDAQRVMGDLDDTLMTNRDNLDETLENIRVSSENLKQFTDTIKQRPFSLIRVKAEKDRVPPSGK